jgi:hypothetical protein
LGVSINIKHAYHTHPRPHPKIKNLFDKQDGISSIFQVLPLPPCDCDKELGMISLNHLNVYLAFNFKLPRTLKKKNVSFVVGSIAEFVGFDSHTFDPLIKELIIIATSNINEPTYDEVDPFILSKVASDLSNIEHLDPTSTTLTNRYGSKCQC